MIKGFHILIDRIDIYMLAFMTVMSMIGVWWLRRQVDGGAETVASCTLFFQSFVLGLLWRFHSRGGAGQ